MTEYERGFRDAVEAAVERCRVEAVAYAESAKVCDAAGNHVGGLGDTHGSLAAARCGDAIRALRPATERAEATCGALDTQGHVCDLHRGHDDVHLHQDSGTAWADCAKPTPAEASVARDWADECNAGCAEEREGLRNAPCAYACGRWRGSGRAR